MTDSTPTARRMIDGRMVDVPMAAAESIHRPGADVAAAELQRQLGDRVAATLPAGELAAALTEPGGNSGGTAAAGVLVATAMHGDLLEHLRAFVRGDHRTAHVDWREVVRVLDAGGMHYVSGGGDALLRIAASLAVGTPVDLRGALGRLDRPNRVMSVRAVAAAAGVPFAWDQADVEQGTRP